MKLYRLIENGEIYTEQEKNECIEESEGEYSEKDFIENEYWETDGEVA